MWLDWFDTCSDRQIWWRTTTWPQKVSSPHTYKWKEIRSYPSQGAWCVLEKATWGYISSLLWQWEDSNPERSEDPWPCPSNRSTFPKEKAFESPSWWQLGIQMERALCAQREKLWSPSLGVDGWWGLWSFSSDNSQMPPKSRTFSVSS